MKVHAPLLIDEAVNEQREIRCVYEFLQLSAVEGLNGGVFLTVVRVERSAFALLNQRDKVIVIRLIDEFRVHHIYKLLAEAEIYVKRKWH